MSNSDILVLHFLISGGFAIWVTMDSKKRGKLEWSHAILSFFLLWWACLPFYLAGRKLLAGETREGGYGWNVCKYFILFWSLLLGYCFLGGMVNLSDHLSQKEMNDTQTAGAAIAIGLGSGMFFCLWIGVAIPVGIIGLLLKKNSVVETGNSQGAQTPGVQAIPALPVRPSAPTEVTVLVARQGKNIGSFDLNAFKQNVAAGLIVPSDHYWTQGMAGWDLVSNFRG
jgi:hypothetical protein